MPDDYMQRLEEARDLIQLAGETAEGRAAARSWLRQAIGDVGEDEPAAPDPAADWRAAQVQAARDLGYTGIALSETGGVGIELYPDVMAAGPNDCNPGPAGTAGTVQYDNAALREAWEADEIARLGLMVQSRRPSRPVYAGLRLSEPQQPEDEAIADDVVQATMDLASRISGANFRDVAEAVDAIALSGSTEDRADALVSLAPPVRAGVAERGRGRAGLGAGPAAGDRPRHPGRHAGRGRGGAGGGRQHSRPAPGHAQPRAPEGPDGPVVG